MTDQTAPNDALLSRIRKLMALTTERGASEAEAATAAAHVQRLLAEHNLSMSAIEASGGNTGEGGKRTKEGVNRKQVYKWQKQLMAAVAELNYCKAMTRHSERGSIYGSRTAVFEGYDLIGRVDNVVTATHMFDYLLDAIERLGREYVGNDPAKYFTRPAHSFKEGCSDRIVERLQERREALVREQEAKVREEQMRARHPGAAKSNLPVVLMTDMIQNEEDLNNDHRWGLEPGTTAQRRRDDEARRVATRDKQARLMTEAVARGLTENEAYYASMGHSDERARQLAAPEEKKPETEAQRRRREERDQRSDEAWRDREYRRQQRERDRLDWGSYRQGEQAGADVGLDRQVDKKSQGGLK